LVVIQKGDKLYLTAQVLLPKKDEFRIGTVVSRRVDDDRKSTGESSLKLILDTRENGVGFDDGTVLKHPANVIAENLYAQVDAEVLWYVLLDVIIDHKKDQSVILKDDEFIKLKQTR
jgi:hypothetical protein